MPRKMSTSILTCLQTVHLPHVVFSGVDGLCDDHGVAGAVKGGR